MHASTTTIFTAAAFCSLASALPTSHLGVRAGGPAITPIPPSCTITQPLSAPDSPPSYLPGPSTNASLLYSAYYASYSSNTTRMARQCLEQCYGYGSHDECKTAFWAQDVVVPTGYYGSHGGGLATACLLFDRRLESADFVAAPPGQGAHAFAASIEC